MASQEQRNYLALAEYNTVDVTVLNWLVENGRVPKDIELRSLIEGQRRGDTTDESPKHFRDAYNEAIIAALNGDEPPEFVRTPYPSVMTFYVAGNWSGPPALSMIDEDFHRLSTLCGLANKLDVNPDIMFTLWHRVITEIDPAMGEEIVEMRHKTNAWYHKVGNICIKDQPAYDAYLDPGARKRFRRGIGERAVRPLGYLLADNHPELLEELVATTD